MHTIISCAKWTVWWFSSALVTDTCIPFLMSFSNSVGRNEIHYITYIHFISTIAYCRCSLPLAYFVSHGVHHELLLLCVVSCRKRITMNQKTFNFLWSRILCQEAILHETSFTMLCWIMQIKSLQVTMNENLGKATRKDSYSVSRQLSD